MTRLQRIRLTAGLVVFAAALPALLPAQAAERIAPAAVRCSSTANVKIGDANGGDKLFFSKKTVTIRPGACVRWTWTGELDHQVLGPGFHSRTRPAPFTYRVRFAKARRAPAAIICGVHSSMKMKVAVKR
jgi:plastocyanin